MKSDVGVIQTSLNGLELNRQIPFRRADRINEEYGGTILEYGDYPMYKGDDLTLEQAAKKGLENNDFHESGWHLYRLVEEEKFGVEFVDLQSDTDWMRDEAHAAAQSAESFWNIEIESQIRPLDEGSKYIDRAFEYCSMPSKCDGTFLAKLDEEIPNNIVSDLDFTVYVFTENDIPRHGGTSQLNSAGYVATDDTPSMAFDENFYRMLSHELAHATKHKHNPYEGGIYRNPLARLWRTAVNNGSADLSEVPGEGITVNFEPGWGETHLQQEFLKRTKALLRNHAPEEKELENLLSDYNAKYAELSFEDTKRESLLLLNRQGAISVTPINDSFRIQYNTSYPDLN